MQLTTLSVGLSGLALYPIMGSFAFTVSSPTRIDRKSVRLFVDDYGTNPQSWVSANDPDRHWTEEFDIYEAKKNGTYWESFEPTDEELEAMRATLVQDEADVLLEQLQALQAEEVEFTEKEKERANLALEMKEKGWSSSAITNTLDVAVDDTLEQTSEAVQSMQEAWELDPVDMATVESHTLVDMDEDTGEPVRQQMVFVDEHTCIGCTNCAVTSPGTFFMEPDMGRARVMKQWGDDDETIQIAIETCPVDCIHYVPFDELKKLEVERRDQNINFKARLVGGGDNGGVGMAHMVGGAAKFTPAPEISGNMGSRCNNCPSRGCRDCPMFGVGKNPAFEKREKERKDKIRKRRLQQERESQQKSAEL